METYEAIYNNGKLIFNKKPKIRKSKVLVTFFNDTEKENKEFPVKSLGVFKSLDRNKFYR